MNKNLTFLLLIVALFTSCAKFYDGNTHRDRLKRINLSDTLNMFVGEKRQIPAVIDPINYSFDSLRFSSTDTTVLTISKTGLLSALEAGTSTIKVSNFDNTISVQTTVTVTPAEPDSLEIGLIAYYPFTSSTADSSGNGYDGIPFNVTPAADRRGHANSAYYFNGTSSYITINDNDDLRLNNTDFTINMWIKLDNYINASGSSLLSKNTGAYQNGWNCSIVGTDNHDGAAPGNLFYNVSGGLDPFAAGTQAISIAQWHMVTVAYQLSKRKVFLYVDGMLDATVTRIPTPNSNTNAKLHIGNNSLTDIDPWANQYFVKGTLDDIRIYNRQLNGTEVLKLFNIAN
jgi:hypothetical protein